VAEAPRVPQLLVPLPAAQRRFGRCLRFRRRWVYRSPCSLGSAPAWGRRGYLFIDLIKVTKTFFLHKRTLSLHLTVTVTVNGERRQRIPAQRWALGSTVQGYYVYQKNREGMEDVDYEIVEYE
jgi:hypothetical protein